MLFSDNISVSFFHLLDKNVEIKTFALTTKCIKKRLNCDMLHYYCSGDNATFQISVFFVSYRGLCLFLCAFYMPLKNLGVKKLFIYG